MPAPFQWTEEKKLQMIAAYEQGEGTNAIAKRFHLRHEAVASMLQEHSIPLRTHPEYARIHICNHAYFHTLDTEEKAYWLGFLTADGCITTGKRIVIHLALADHEHLIKLKQAINATQTISQNARSCSLTFCSPEMATDLARHGIQPRKTFSTKPAQVTTELARHYWRGVLDGDGFISKDGDILTLVGDYEIVQGFQAFVLTHCPYVKAKIYRKEHIYSFKLMKDATKCILQAIYKGATVYLHRKYERARRALPEE